MWTFLNYISLSLYQRLFLLSDFFFFFFRQIRHICSYFLILDFPVFLHELPFFLLLILSHHHYTSYHRFSQEFHLQGNVFFLFFTPSNRTLLPRTRDLQLRAYRKSNTLLRSMPFLHFFMSENYYVPVYIR